MRAYAKFAKRDLGWTTNPTDDIQKKWDMLARQSCKFSPVSRIGNRYSYSSTCDKNGLALRMTSVIIVESKSGYRVETESQTNSRVQKEILVAMRVGDCPK